MLNAQRIFLSNTPNRSRYHLLSECVNYCVIVVVRECAVCAILDTVREYFRCAGTVRHVIQRAVAEQAVKILGIICLVAREIFTLSVTEKAGTVLHR